METLKEETAKVILDELDKYLPLLMVNELSIAFAIRPSITICCTVNGIIKEYNSSQENEDKVNALLEKFLQIHFSPIAIELPEER